MAFRLERVLRLRGQLCRLRRLEMQSVEGEHGRLRATRSEVEVERGAVLEELAARSTAGGVDVASYRLARAYEDALGERAVFLDGRIAEARERLNRKREQLAAERREERKLEFLAEQHHAAAEVAAALAAERLLDELMLARHARDDEGEARGG